MEPRPNKPSRAPAGSSPESSTPDLPGDSASWATSAWTSPANPASSSTRAEPTPHTEPFTARAADWRGQPGAYAPGADQGYSPGPSLAPIDQRRGSGWLGPLIAIAVLALIVVAVAVAFTKVRGGNSDRSALPPAAQVGAPGLTGTAQAAAGAASQAAATAPAVTTTARAGAAVKATVVPGGNAKPTSTPKANATTVSASAANLLPALGDVGPGFVVTENATRDRDAVSQSFVDPNDATAKLKTFGWKENAYTTFEIPAADATDPTATTLFSVSVHRFSKSSGAKSAFTYFSDAVVAGQGLADVDIANLSDQTRELSSTSADGNLVVIYVRKGVYLIKASASSPTGDPTADLIALVKKLVK